MQKITHLIVQAIEFTSTAFVLDTLARAEQVSWVTHTALSTSAVALACRWLDTGRLAGGGTGLIVAVVWALPSCWSQRNIN